LRKRKKGGNDPHTKKSVTEEEKKRGKERGGSDDFSVLERGEGEITFFSFFREKITKRDAGKKEGKGPGATLCFARGGGGGVFSHRQKEGKLKKKKNPGRKKR